MTFDEAKLEFPFGSEVIVSRDLRDPISRVVVAHLWQSEELERRCKVENHVEYADRVMLRVSQSVDLGDRIFFVPPDHVRLVEGQFSG
jgi:hypothetical protein